MNKAEKIENALGDMIAAARVIRHVNERQGAHTRHLQELAADARRTGESQTHRIRPMAFDYGDGVAALLDALERYEKTMNIRPSGASRGAK